MWGIYIPNACVVQGSTVHIYLSDNLLILLIDHKPWGSRTGSRSLTTVQPVQCLIRSRGTMIPEQVNRSSKEGVHVCRGKPASLGRASWAFQLYRHLGPKEQSLRTPITCVISSSSPTKQGGWTSCSLRLLLPLKFPPCEMGPNLALGKWVGLDRQRAGGSASW